MVNSKIAIEYYDQNEEFAKFLPRKGQIVQQLADEYGNNDWFLVKLDEPFEYQLKLGEPFQFKLINCNKILVRSRWKNQKITAEGASVFIMLIPDDSKLNNCPIQIDDYVQIAWGYAKLI